MKRSHMAHAFTYHVGPDVTGDLFDGESPSHQAQMGRVDAAQPRQQQRAIGLEPFHQMRESLARFVAASITVPLCQSTLAISHFSIFSPHVKLHPYGYEEPDGAEEIGIVHVARRASQHQIRNGRQDGLRVFRDESVPVKAGKEEEERNH